MMHMKVKGAHCESILELVSYCVCACKWLTSALQTRAFACPELVERAHFSTRALTSYFFIHNLTDRAERYLAFDVRSSIFDVGRSNLRFCRFIMLMLVVISLFLPAVADDNFPSPYPVNLNWIWYPEGNAAAGAPRAKRYFRSTVSIPADAKILCAHFIVNADDSAQPFVNGRPLPRTEGGWLTFDTYDVTAMLKRPQTVLAVEVDNHASAAGLIGWFVVRTEKEVLVLSRTDDKWKSFNNFVPTWEQPGFDDSKWSMAMKLGPPDMAPWGARMRYRRTPMLQLARRRKGDKVTPAMAKQLVEQDWTFQADDRMTPSRSLKEIGWARDVAARFSKSSDQLGFSSELAELSKLEAQLKALPPGQENNATRELYFAVRRIKRSIMLRNPLLDFDKLLLVDSPAYSGRHESSHRNGYHYRGRSGSRLLVLDGLRPDGSERELVSGDEGFIMRMDLAFDTSKVVFSLKPKEEQSFHLYEIGVDGQNRRQLTNSAYDDMDPIYLPDGKIIFSTSRGNTYVRCLPQSASTVLARCDADGRNIRIISRNNEPDYTPTLLPDGRILYTRWEYTERPLWRLQKLWTINPDGTGLAVYWGNGSAYPDMLWEARPIPGTRQVMFAGVGHHNVHTGSLGIIDVSRGLQCLTA